MCIEMLSSIAFCVSVQNIRNYVYWRRKRDTLCVGNKSINSSHRQKGEVKCSRVSFGMCVWFTVCLHPICGWLRFLFDLNNTTRWLFLHHFQIHPAKGDKFCAQIFGMCFVCGLKHCRFIWTSNFPCSRTIFDSSAEQILDFLLYHIIASLTIEFVYLIFDL